MDVINQMNLGDIYKTFFRGFVCLSHNALSGHMPSFPYRFFCSCMLWFLIFMRFSLCENVRVFSPVSFFF